MNPRRIWLAAGIILCVIVIGFLLSVPHTTEAPRALMVENKAAPAPIAVTLHDSYKKNVHKLTGSLLLPNPCTAFTATATTTGTASTSQAIAIDIEVAPDTGVCLQVPKTGSFTLSANGPANLRFDVTVNGAEASTTLE